MSAGTSQDRQEIVDRVRGWPADSRLELARGIMSTLNQPPSRPRISLRDLLGLISAQNAVPDDATCRVIVEDALIEKHGR
jgi:hypothetical protein